MRAPDAGARLQSVGALAQEDDAFDGIVLVVAPDLA
jgi:hypothetical protein